jgi:hypothetical protein
MPTILRISAKWSAPTGLYALLRGLISIDKRKANGYKRL